MRRISKAAGLGALVLALAACGGSDSGGEDVDGGGSGGPPPPVLTTIVVSPADAIVGIGLTKTVTAEARDQNGVRMSGVVFTWMSSNGAVGSVAGGVATGIAAGTTDITASSGGVASPPARLTVVAVKKASVVVDRPGLFLAGVGETAHLTAQAFDAAGTASGGSVTWTSSAPDKVSIDADGRVSALAIGSAQIRAESNGVRSAPTLVVVAKPKAGALLLRDAQIASVGAPTAAAGTLPGVGSTYEVALRGGEAPAPGTVVLSLETAPVAGMVVSVRDGAAGPVLTLAIAPLHRLLDAYDIGFTIALADFELEAASVPAPLKVPGKLQRAVWGDGSDFRKAVPAAGHKALEPFKPFDCDAKLEPQLLGKTTQLTLENGLNLVVIDVPGYSKRALEGSGRIVGSAGLKLNAGFKAKGECRAKAQIKIPAFGWVSVFVMPGVSFGLGVEVEGEVLLVQGELGVEGTVGVAGSLGYECGGATPACRGLDQLSPTYDLKTKSRMPSDQDPQAKVSAHFYVYAGLDAVILGGVGNAELVEARLGPKQSFDMAYEKHQAARPEYASAYELTFEGVIKPGAALEKAIEAVIDSDTTSLTFQSTFGPIKLSESPKGTLAIDKARVRPDATVNFSVDMDPATVSYFLLGYNIAGLELWRKRDDEAEFSFWKYMEATATNGTNFRYAWKPTEADAGTYEFAAFVSTKNKIETVTLEVKPDSKRPLEVQCFSGGKPAKGAPRLQGANACVDSYDGTSIFVVDTPGAPGNSITATANITWVYDPSNSAAGVTRYKATGRIAVAWSTTNGCTLLLSPSSFAIKDAPMEGATGGLAIFKGNVPPSYSFGGMQMVDTTVTTVCPGKEDRVAQLRGLQVGYALGSGPFTGQATLEGSTVDAAGSSTWRFTRP